MVMNTSVGEPEREIVREPDVIWVPPIRQPGESVPDHLPDTITLPEREPVGV